MNSNYLGMAVSSGPILLRYRQVGIVNWPESQSRKAAGLGFGACAFVPPPPAALSVSHERL